MPGDRPGSGSVSGRRVGVGTARRGRDRGGGRGRRERRARPTARCSTTATDAGGLDGAAAREHPRRADPEQQDEGDATDGGGRRDRPVSVRSAVCRRGDRGPGTDHRDDFGRGEGTASGRFHGGAGREPGAGSSVRGGSVRGGSVPSGSVGPAPAPPAAATPATAAPAATAPAAPPAVSAPAPSPPPATSVAEAASTARTAPAAAAAAAAAAASLSACAASRRCSATNAAPSAIECFGCASTAIGRPVDSRTISATSGMRDDPPTSRMRSTPSKPRPALLTARPSAAIVSVIRGRIISSNSSRVRRISVWRPGRTTWIVVSVSDESASLARRHSSRSRAMAARTAGSFGSTVDAASADLGHHAGEERLVEVDPAEALHPLGSPELLEAVLGLAQDRGVERPAAEVVDGDDRAGRHALLAGRSGRRPPRARSAGSRSRHRPGGWPARGGRSCRRRSSRGGSGRSHRAGRRTAR